MSLDTLEETVFDFDRALKSYHRYSERELYEFLKTIETIVDNIIIQHRPSKPTDFKFRTFNDMLGEYENVMKALREAIMSKDYVRARSLLQELVTVVRRLNRNLAFLSSETLYLPTVEGAKELERYVGEGKVAEHLDEFDERVKDLSHTAKMILSQLYRSPLREINLKDLPIKLGLTERGSSRIVSDAVDELTKKLPDVVKVVPDTIRSGMKIVLLR